MFDWLTKRFSKLRLIQEDCRLVSIFLRTNGENLEDLIKFYTEFPTKWEGRHVWYSPSAMVRIEYDIYGYEVSLAPSWKHGQVRWLDTCPAYYGLDREQAGRLMDAILSNVPGSVAFQKKHIDSKKAVAQ